MKDFLSLWLRGAIAISIFSAIIIGFALLVHYAASVLIGLVILLALIIVPLFVGAWIRGYNDDYYGY